METKKRVFSGVQPTGKIHLGNYIGAISVWAQNQNAFDNIFCVVDLHAITIPEAVDPTRLREKTLEVAALYLACGIDPRRSTIFVQSHVHEHSELAWILNCVTPVGWLQRMTQFKDKSRHSSVVGTGLLDYPVLQAADILLYDTDCVPVGEDQKQHVELARDIAQRFNSLWGNVLRIPQPLIRTSGARIMGLDDPTAKMSKSIGAVRSGHSIGLLDPPDEIRRSILRSTTDSGSEISFDKSASGVRNLLVIYQSLSGENDEAVESRFTGQGYAKLKRSVAELVIEKLGPIQAEYALLREDEPFLMGLLSRGSEQAQTIAALTLKRIKDAVGLLPTA
jgi:tryptophanyl-tRNA synthetase